jgi:Flp pilus assembly pilin Flp
MIDAIYVQTEDLVAADSSCMLCGAHTSRHTSCARCKRTLCWRCARPAGGVRMPPVGDPAYDPSQPLAVVCGVGRGCAAARALPEQEGDTQPTLARISRGQGLVEYALILALVALVVIGVLIIFSSQIGSFFSSIGNTL